MSYEWIVLLGLAALWFIAMARMRRRLRHYQQKVADLRSARESIDETLKHHAHRFDELLDAVYEAVLRLDAEGRVLAANARARQVFGLSEQHGPGQAMIFFYRDPDWLKAFSDSLRRLPEPARLPEMKLGKWVLAPRLAPLGSNQALLLCMDVTDQVRLERQRRTFLANLMHDLKTPLTSLLGYARSLETFGHDKAFRQEAARVIADEAKHVNHLLDALLTLDQIEFAVRDRHACSAPDDVLHAVAELLRPQLEDKHITLDIRQPEALPAVAMQADDLERVLTNVLDNAVRYSPADSRIQCSLRADGDHLECLIEDEGPGVPEKELPRLTERFYRVNKARSRREGGHGLGLAIVQELLDLHGGTLAFANCEPNGLQVRMHLPVAESGRQS